MYFGPDLGSCGGRKVNYSVEVEAKLLAQQACWSGEVVYDYIFEVCNQSIILGIFCCHPCHPYGRWVRLGVAIIVFSLIVCPLSLMPFFLHQGGVFYFLIISALVTAPRNLVKLILKSVAVQAAELRIEQGARLHGVRISKALHREIAILICSLVLASLLCILTMKVLTDRGRDAMEIMKENCEGMGYAIVLELIVGLIFPYSADGPNGEKKWNIGFFGRWRYEKEIALLAHSKVRPKQTPGKAVHHNLNEDTDGDYFVSRGGGFDV